MSKKSIKINNITYNDVDTIRLVDADNQSQYDKFVETSDGDVTASDIITGKSAYANGEKITGTYDLPSGSVTYTNNGNFDVEHKAEAIVNVEGGVTPTYQEKTVTPTTTQQIITPDNGYDALSKVTVDGDEDLISNNIKNGVEVFGVTGDYEGAGKTGSFVYMMDNTGSTNLYKVGTVGEVVPYYYNNALNPRFLYHINEDAREFPANWASQYATYHNPQIESDNGFTNITKIGGSAFRNSKIWSNWPLVWPSVTSVGSAAFMGWGGNTTELVFPKWQEITEDAFIYLDQFSPSQAKVTLGSVGYPVNVSTMVKLGGSSNSNGKNYTFTFYCSPTDADALLTKVRGWTQAIQEAHIIVKAAEDGIYGGQEVAAGDTLIDDVYMAPTV